MARQDIRLTLDASDCYKAKALYEEAFPEGASPFGWTVEHSDFYLVYDEGEIIALYAAVRGEGIDYLFYLAVAKEKRNRGFGGKLLEELKEKLNAPKLYLLALDPDEETEDQPLRKRRIAFYERHGFLLGPNVLLEYGMRYRILSARGTTSLLDHLRLMYEFGGEEFFRAAYPLEYRKLLQGKQ